MTWSDQSTNDSIHKESSLSDNDSNEDLNLGNNREFGNGIEFQFKTLMVPISLLKSSLIASVLLQLHYDDHFIFFPLFSVNEFCFLGSKSKHNYRLFRSNKTDFEQFA